MSTLCTVYTNTFCICNIQTICSRVYVILYYILFKTHIFDVSIKIHNKQDIDDRLHKDSGIREEKSLISRDMNLISGRYHSDIRGERATTYIDWLIKTVLYKGKIIDDNPASFSSQIDNKEIKSESIMLQFPCVYLLFSFTRLANWFQWWGNKVLVSSQI